MKKIIFAALLFVAAGAKAQKIDSIFVNLYTDSLKKGTYNYINVDGLYSNGSYLPLDSTDIIFTSTYGTFYGNSLWLEPDFKEKKVKIKVEMRKNKKMCREFEMYIKTKEDNEKLLTNEEMLDKIKSDIKKKKKDKN